MDTLGDETVGFVMMDPSAVSPMTYDQLEVLNGIIGSSSVRLTIDSAMQDKRWRKVNDATIELGEKWSNDFKIGAQQMLKETWVKNTDPHIDAKIFPTLHPYGTGSLAGEVGSGGGNGIPRL